MDRSGVTTAQRTDWAKRFCRIRAWREAGSRPVINCVSRKKPSENRICNILDERVFCIYTPRMITWDEPKRLENLRKHEIDLAELESAFDFPMITVEDSRQDYGELRLQSLGWWQGRVIFLVWTPRGDDTAHLISCRYANLQQVETYFKAV
jgi:uncharacterized protein